MTPSADNPERHAAISFEYELDAPPALVWRALTIPEYVARWLAPGAVERDADAPAQQDAASLPVSIHLLDQEPCQSVRYLWRDGASPFNWEAKLSFNSLVGAPELHPCAA